MLGLVFFAGIIGLFGAEQGSSNSADAKEPKKETDPGHSDLGEAFNEGPRQAAYFNGRYWKRAFSHYHRFARGSGIF